MEFALSPGPVLWVLVAEVLYLRAVRILGRRGWEVPFWQQVAWHAAVLCVAAGLMGPVDSYAEDLLIAHMGQHLLIADIAAPLLLIGLRTPVYAFLLPRPALVAVARQRRLRAAFRFLRQPLVAVPVWVVTLYGWHIGFMFEGALANGFVHALQHWSFVAASVLVWWSVIEPKRSRVPGALWKVPYLLGARLAGMFLGMAFIIMRSPAYEQYALNASAHGIAPITDQQIAGAMMLALDLFVMLLATGFFFHRSAEDRDRAAARAAERAAPSPLPERLG